MISPSEELSFHVNVPLAAFILEYSVAYCPDDFASEDGPSTYLSRIPLDVYECILSFASIEGSIMGKQRLDAGSATASPRLGNRGQSKTHTHSLLKFSCPAQLHDFSPGLHPVSLISQLRSKFVARIARSGITCTLKVQHSTVTLDGIAL